jgi:hypothetical protein
MNERQQRVRALARWITTRAEVLLLMRRALQASCEALLDEGSADEEPMPIRNALPRDVVDERR